MSCFPDTKLRPSKLFPVVLACCVAWPVAAQDADAGDGRIRVVPAENVKLDYAQVLRVEPVYQTLRATRVEERCESTPVIRVQAPPGEDEERPGAFSRMVDSVKGLFSREDAGAQTAAAEGGAATQGSSAHDGGCHLVRVERQFQRPIAYDVDYVYKGTKYRSRLAEDPGNRVRVRVSVAPWVDDMPVAGP